MRESFLIAQGLVVAILILYWGPPLQYPIANWGRPIILGGYPWLAVRHGAQQAFMMLGMMLSITGISLLIGIYYISNKIERFERLE